MDSHEKKGEPNAEAAPNSPEQNAREAFVPEQKVAAPSSVESGSDEDSESDDVESPREVRFTSSFSPPL